MHTQGIWTFDGDEWVFDEDGYDVAHIGLNDRNGDRSEMVANGQLIAAVPDAGFTRGVTGVCASGFCRTRRRWWHRGEVVVRAFNAINKALGENCDVL